MGGLEQHPPKGSSCSLTPPTAPESLQPLALAPSRPSLSLFFSPRHFIIDPPFPRPILGLGRGGGKPGWGESR